MLKGKLPCWLLHGAQETMRVLLSNKAVVLDDVDLRGETALYQASSKGRVTNLKILIEFGANVNHKAKNGTSPLMAAAMLGHTDAVDILISNGADIDYAVEKRSALTLANMNRHKDVAELLIKLGANPKFNEVPSGHNSGGKCVCF